ncbi:MAG: hypothetical protein V4638_03720 [Bacteroidota bacterium]
MGWKEISKTEYCELFTSAFTIFHTADFNELNSAKVEHLHYLSFAAENCQYGIILGEKASNLNSPFSAPFGGLIYVGNFSQVDLSEVALSLLQWATTNRTSLYISFPPTFYDEKFISLAVNELINNGFSIKYSDLNAHYLLDSETTFFSRLARNARKNLSAALKNDYSFSRAETIEQKETAYAIIKKNRAEKGFPLKMSFEDLQSTNELIAIDYFTLEMNEHQCAAAIVFTISSTTAMVVYWGNLSAFAELRPMNLLAKLVFEYYQQVGKQFLDIGPSSEFGVINEGLASFKKSIGCESSNKYSLKFEYV